MGNNILDSVSQSKFRLGPRTFEEIGGVKVRLHDDARKLVAFLGLRTTDQSGASVPKFGGTGFFVSFPAAPQFPDVRFTYLITARHVAENLAGPFVVGLNNTEGALDLLDIDKADWTYHPDPDVDLAAIQLRLSGADWLPIGWEGFASNRPQFPRFGIGDLVYIVGLYRLFPGSAKISPVVHTGHVAMTPDEEIPIRNRVTGKVTKTRGYLVEAQTLDGLSGSPVMIRFTNPTGMSTGTGTVVAYTEDVFLLGLWQGSWDGIAGDTLAEEVGRGTKVPVGMGITIPVQRITELLDMRQFAQERDRWVSDHAEANAATTDNVGGDGSGA